MSVLTTVCLLLPARAASFRQTTPPFADFAEFLIARDLVLVGEVVGVSPAVRRWVGGRGQPPEYGLPFTRLTLDVGEVWYGTAEDSVVQVSIPGLSDSSETPPLGSRLLVWGSREGDDAWRLWGTLATVTSAGRVVEGVSKRGFISVAGHPKGEPPFLELLQQATEEKRFGHSTAVLRNNESLGLGRLTKVLERPEGGYTYVCDSVGFLVGGEPRFPRHLDFPLVPDCFPEIFPGDSLLVPIPRGFSGARVTLPTCPRALAVKQAFLRGFGVPLGSVTRAIGRDERGLYARPFVMKTDD